MPDTPHKKLHHAVRIPKTIMDKFKYIAAYHGRSANKEMERLILHSITTFEQKNGIIPLDESEDI